MTHEAWVVALDRLEVDVTLAERLADDPGLPSSDVWIEPQLAGPIPPALVDRARDLLVRQQRAQESLVAALAATGRQQDFTTKVDRATRRTEPSLYLDVTA